MRRRFKETLKVLLYVLFLNLLVAFAKLFYGTFTGTLSMVADGYHSLFDGISNVVGMTGIYIASRPPDREHPYGHKKYETLASVFIAILLILVAFEIFQDSLGRFFTRDVPDVTAVSFLIMLGTMGINYLVTCYEQRKGVSLQSEVLIADSMHTKSDIYVSFSVIASLAAIRVGYPLLDPFVAILISFLIIREGIRIIKRSAATLLDTSRLDEDEICDIVMSVEGVVGCHKIRTRGPMGEIRIDMHLLVRPGIPIEEAHLISHSVSKILKSEYDGIEDVFVHIEPAIPLPEESNSKKTS